jgi:hypothetical protein
VADGTQKIVTEPPGPENVTGVGKAADRRPAHGDAAFVADPGIALAGAYGSDAERIRQYRSVFDHVLRLLATTPGTGPVTRALRLVTSPEVAGRKPSRHPAAYTASLLASSHPAQETAARVRESTRCGFAAGTEWFVCVAWDIGLATLSAGRRRLAVLAAADTD